MKKLILPLLLLSLNCFSQTSGYLTNCFKIHEISISEYRYDTMKVRMQVCTGIGVPFIENGYIIRKFNTYGADIEHPYPDNTLGGYGHWYSIYKYLTYDNKELKDDNVWQIKYIDWNSKENITYPESTLLSGTYYTPSIKTFNNPPYNWAY